MGQVRQKIDRDELRQISDNVAQIRHERDCLEVRQLAITRTLRELERQLQEVVDYEEELDLQGAVDNLCTIGSDLERHRMHLENDLSKINRGLKTLSSLRGAAGRRALTAYIKEDTELSIESVRQVRSYYDQVVAAIKNIV